VTDLDMVRDTTVADVRFEVASRRRRAVRPSVRAIRSERRIVLSPNVAEDR